MPDFTKQQLIELIEKIPSDYFHMNDYVLHPPVEDRRNRSENYILSYAQRPKMEFTIICELKE